jgi:hypothetical protein
MPLLTELENVLGLDFYKYVAPDGAAPFSARCTASRSHRRCEFFWTNFFDGRKVKIVKQKSHARPARKTGYCDRAETSHNMRSYSPENNVKLRTIEKQFKPNKAKKIRSFQRRLGVLRTTGEASDYFFLEAIYCLEAGLVLAALQIATAALELLARQILIQQTIVGLNDRKGSAYRIETKFEEDKGYAFYGILNALNARKIINDDEREQLKNIYLNTRIPLHHGIVGRYSRLREKDSLTLNILFDDSQVHLTTGQSGFEKAIDKFGLDDINHVISGLEILNPKFRKASWPCENSSQIK